MANDLTGDYDVVAEFTLAAVHRILAGMHRGNRLPHSLSMRVDDTPDSKRSARSAVDIFGNAISDRVRVAQTDPSRTLAGAPGTEFIPPGIDPHVNASDGFRPDPHLLYSHLQGVAQLQLGVPILDLAEGASATVVTPVRVRYFPDPQTLSLPQLMRGEIRTTVGVRSANTAVGTFIQAGLEGPAGNIRFNQIWPEQRMDPDKLSAVNLALRNSVITSFQPSNTALPATVSSMDFKTLPDAPAVAALMSLNGGAASPDSMQTVFLHDGDQFAMAFNGELIGPPFAQAVNASIQPRQQTLDTKVVIDYLIGTWTFHIFTTITVLDARVELLEAPSVVFGVPGSGQILLTIPVQVRFGWEDKPSIAPDPVNFDFTVSQAFTLSLNGGQVGIQTLGSLAIDIPPNVPADEADPARKQAATIFESTWSANQNRIQDMIKDALSVERLRKFLSDLMNPAIAQKSDTPAEKRLVKVDPQLTYTSFEIKSSGIVLHGALALPDWPPAHVEFDLDPWTANTLTPEFNALNSWIPGGTIDDLVWSYRGKARDPEPNTFVSDGAPAIGWSPSSVCLRVEGSRLTAAGPVGRERVVSPPLCKGTTVPKAVQKGFPGGNLARLPLVWQAPPRGPAGKLEVVGHASPWAEPGENTANFLIHFPDAESAVRLDFLTRALQESGRSDTATAILCVLAPGQLAEVRLVDGLLFADDADGWQRLFDIGSRPATVLLSPSGDVVWRLNGAVAASSLAEALKKHLAAGGFFRPRFLESSLRIGQRAPNFHFEAAPGQNLTLRKLAGRPVVLLFGRSSSRPSRETLEELRHFFANRDVERPAILAVADGEAEEDARRLAAGTGVTVVPDPERWISQAYGVRAWPTTVFLDVESTVGEIRYGVFQPEELRPATGTKPRECPPPGKEY